jgi:DNA-directed RNA polymerase specialized sigma24 family protein
MANDEHAPQWLARLLDEHGAALVLYARQWCATPEDVVQEALLQLVTQRRRPDNVLGWLYRVVRNGAISTARGQSRRAQREARRLQVIEAVRMHAAATGKLPATLEEITVVPVPLDPASGKPFRYVLDESAAVIDLAEETGIRREDVKLPVRIRLREKE